MFSNRTIQTLFALMVVQAMLIMTRIHVVLQRVEEYGLRAAADGQHRQVSTAVALVEDPMPPKSKTIALYICNNLHSKMQMEKIQELYSYFHQDLIIVTDQEEEDIPDDDNWILPANQVITNNSIPIETNYLFSQQCCGQERSIEWLISNQHRFDYAWIMEDDVQWNNFVALKEFFDHYEHDDTTDLLHSNANMENRIVGLTNWRAQQLTVPFVEPAAAFSPPYHKGWFYEFYRASRPFIMALEDWRVNKNGGKWMFFEPLYANIVFRKDTPTPLEQKCYRNNTIGMEVNIRYRPCYVADEVFNTSNSAGAIFHPVKETYDTTPCGLDANGDPEPWKPRQSNLIRNSRLQTKHYLEQQRD